MKKIRILMVLGNTGRGGSQAFVMNVIRNIDLNRFIVDVAVSESKKDGYDDELKSFGCSIIYYPRFVVVNSIYFEKRWFEILREGKYDIVHGHASSSAAIYLKIAKKCGCVTIVHSHSAGYRGNAFVRIAKRWYSRNARKQADYWFACSDVAAERLFGAAYKQNRKYYAIPNAINTERFIFDDNVRTRIRTELGVGCNDVLFGHVGTFSPPKNHEFIIGLFEKIVKKLNKCKLVLVGDGILKEEIERSVKRRNLESNTVFTGNVENPEHYLMAMDYLIFPSIFEGFPVTLIEAQATGLRCVVSDCITKEVAITDLVRFVSLHESEEWIRVLLSQVKTKDRTEYNRIIKDTNYNITVLILKLESLYETILSED